MKKLDNLKIMDEWKNFSLDSLFFSVFSDNIEYLHFDDYNEVTDFSALYTSRSSQY